MRKGRIVGMLDLAYVRANLPVVEEKLRARNMDPAVVLRGFADLDDRRRDAITRLETLKMWRNTLSERIAEVKRAGEDASPLMEQVRNSKGDIEAGQVEVDQFEGKLSELLQAVPNMPQDSVPIGKSEHDNRIEKVWDGNEKLTADGSPDTAYTPAAPAYPPQPHWEIGERLGILDFERAAKISGSRFVVHYGQGARLERALANFMLDLHTREHGYTEVLPPYMVNADSLYGTGQLPKFEQDLFKVPTDSYEKDRHHSPVPGELVLAQGQTGTFRVVSVGPDGVLIELVDAAGFPFDPQYRTTVPRGALFYRRSFYLIPTAEVPVTNLFRDETLDESQLTTSFCAYTPCFRSEAGSYGKDVRGMIRQHQFQKVELVKFCRPQDSNAEHERLTRDAERVLELLGLPYRRMLLCTGDMGFASAKTYDLEVWLPGQNLYREISSCSNFEAFQARRANIRFKPSGSAQGKSKKSEFVHTLNGSGLAVGRTYLAVLENYQQADGSVRIPQALQPYMNGETVIAPQKHTGRS